MPALADNVLLIFVLLSPGFLFILFFYNSGRLSRADIQHGVVFDTAAMIVLSVLAHSLAGLIYFGVLGLFPMT